MNRDDKPLLGELLVKKNIISQEELNIALKAQKESGKKIGHVLVELGFIDQELALLPTLAEQMGSDFVSLKGVAIPPEVIGKIPAKFVSHYKVIPFDLRDNSLYIAMENPMDIQTLDEVGLVVSEKIVPILAIKNDILEAIRKYYGVGAETIEQMMDTVIPKAKQSNEIVAGDEIESEASISKFLNQILLEAHRDRATDIHIEPFEDELHIRYRVDGVLYDAKVPSNIKHFKDAINSRIKILSNLNIAEKRLPQDGRFKVHVQGAEIDLRVSFLPTPFGESVVLRVLNTSALLGFDQLGLSNKERAILDHLIVKPHGIIFLTGPTGSGKTTTLYSCLSKMNTDEKKIITIEDPIEYQLNGITQIQVNPGIKLTFAHGLRSMLRHDPDVMMVGEVRDIETAEIAIQVALTGHLVFSTLHTNDAASGVTRLLDMGVEPFLITSTVECFIAQRLVRMLCQRCKMPMAINDDIKKRMHLEANETPPKIYTSKGCEQCHFTGYSGRSAIYEFLVFNENIRDLIIKRASADEIKECAIKTGMKTLSENGWEKVKLGLTSPQEIIRVTEEEEGIAQKYISYD